MRDLPEDPMILAFAEKGSIIPNALPSNDKRRIGGILESVPECKSKR